MQKRVVIDAFPESAQAYLHGYAIIVVDVIRATTSAITVAATGARCFPVPSIEAARRLAAQFPDSLLAGETGGQIPPDFHLNNSPSQLASQCYASRPVILLSSSGTRLLYESRNCDAVYLACLRNWRYTAEYLAGHYEAVAVIGAGTKGEFREEDQLCCAWVAGALVEEGFVPQNGETRSIVNAWGEQGPEAILESRSVAYLKRTGQLEDLDFILSHIDDLPGAFMQRNGEVVMSSSGKLRPNAPTQTAFVSLATPGEIC